MRRYKFNVPVGEQLHVQMVGNYVRLEDSPAPVVVEDLDNNQYVTMENGDDVILKPFKRIAISHEMPTPQLVTLSLGMDTKKSSSRIGGTVTISSISTPINLSRSDTIVSVPDVVVAMGIPLLLLPAEPTRREVIIGGHLSNTGITRIGDSAVSGSNGKQVAAGTEITIESTAAIYAFVALGEGVAQTLTVLKIMD